jgi:hypothetical protein
MAGSLRNRILLLAAFSGSAAFASETFLCTFQSLSKDAWIPPKVSMQFSEHRETARIWASDEGAPVSANLEKRSDSSYLLDWTVPRTVVAKATSLSANRYRVILNVDNLKVSLQVLAKKSAVAPSSRGVGSCIILEDLPE